MKRQKHTIGAIVKIKIDHEFQTYARILNNASYAFYDCRTKNDIKDLNLIASKPILFILSVYKSAITKGRWLKIGTLPLEEKLKSLPLTFIQDDLNPNIFQIYDPNTGEFRKALKEECLDLECASVWEAEHVEERLRDHYDGKPNVWVEQLRIKL